MLSTIIATMVLSQCPGGSCPTTVQYRQPVQYMRPVQYYPTVVEALQTQAPAYTTRARGGLIEIRPTATIDQPPPAPRPVPNVSTYSIKLVETQIKLY